MRRLALLPVLVCLLAPAAAQAGWRSVADPSARPDVPAITVSQDLRNGTVILRSWYPTWNGHRRALTILYPKRFTGTGTALPLVVAAHQAGGASTCVDPMASLPGRFGFVLACLDGQGDFTRSFSYGSPGQIADLAGAPRLIAGRLPGMRIDARRMTIVGSSMGGTEALLVGLRYPTAYDRAIALDPISDLGTRFASLPYNRRYLLAAECDGPPAARAGCYAERSPVTFVGPRPDGSAVLDVWYSTADPVSGAVQQVPRFVAAERGVLAPGQLRVRVGTWGHGALWDDADHRAAWLIDAGVVPVGGLPAVTGFGRWPD
ncbi:MAG: alpha/beta hydrolase family protein [Gaiellales bacterium]